MKTRHKAVIDATAPVREFKRTFENYGIALRTSFSLGYYYGAIANRSEINRLLNKTLKRPLAIVVEPDSDGYIARTPDIPVYGFGDDQVEAIETLKSEIESLYNDLMEDDEFTDDWLSIKQFLRELID